MSVLSPLIAPTEDELNFAFAASLFDLFRAMSHLPGAELQEHAQLSRHFATPFNPMFKGVWQSAWPTIGVLCIIFTQTSLEP
jgi:hypothetical protein